MKEFQKLDAAVLGISPDSVESHKLFIDKFDLSVTLLSDPENTTLSDYGVWGSKTYDGVKYMGASRATFIIDPNGKLAHIWSKVNAQGHAGDVLRKLTELTKT